MRRKREKFVQKIIASIVTLVLSYALFLATDTNAKENNTPGQKIKQIVHEYNHRRNTGDEDKEELKQEVKDLKNEIVEEAKNTDRQNNDNVRGSSDENNNDSPQPFTPIPTVNPTTKPPTVTPPITIYPSPVPTISVPEPTTSPDFSSCTATGGTWKQFPNSCVDSCALAENPSLMCLQVLTDGCDCGPSSCWNGSECALNPAVLGSQKPTPTIEVPPPIGKSICGNGICEEGEGTGGVLCNTCDDPTKPCTEQCLHYPSTCEQDCNTKPINPIY